MKPGKKNSTDLLAHRPLLSSREDREIARRLSDLPAGEPPADLLDRLRADVPADLGSRLDRAAEEAGEADPERDDALPPARPPRRWLAAAAVLVTLVGGGYLAWQLTAGAPAPATWVEERAVEEPTVEEEAAEERRVEEPTAEQSAAPVPPPRSPAAEAPDDELHEGAPGEAAEARARQGTAAVPEADVAVPHEAAVPDEAAAEEERARELKELREPPTATPRSTGAEGPPAASRPDAGKPGPSADLREGRGEASRSTDAPAAEAPEGVAEGRGVEATDEGLAALGEEGPVSPPASRPERAEAEPFGAGVPEEEAHPGERVSAMAGDRVGDVVGEMATQDAAGPASRRLLAPSPEGLLRGWPAAVTWLQEGRLPPPSAVPVREAVESQPYGDPLPETFAPGEGPRLTVAAAPPPWAAHPRELLLFLHAVPRPAGGEPEETDSRLLGFLYFDSSVVERWREVGSDRWVVTDPDGPQEAVWSGAAAPDGSLAALLEVRLRAEHPAERNLGRFVLRRLPTPGGIPGGRALTQGRPVDVALGEGSVAASWAAAPPDLRLAAVAGELARALRRRSETAPLEAVRQEARALAAHLPPDDPRSAAAAELADLAERAAALLAAETGAGR